MSASSPTGNATLEHVGFVGLGTMGSAMAANLARAGFPLVVWNRSEGRSRELETLGARTVESPAALARSCSIVVACLTDSPEVEAVLFGPEGLRGGFRGGSLFIDCSTISPVKAAEFAERLARQDVAMLDAPVSGGSEGARNATLSIMVGGEESEVARARGVLSAMGRSITHLGPVGSGQWAKAINQVILAGVYLGVAEGVTLGLKAGLDVERVVTSLKSGAAGSWVLENRSQQMIDDDYPLGFKIALHRKDVGIALDLAERVGAELPVTALAAGFEDALINDGYGEDDVSALARCLRRLAGL